LKIGFRVDLDFAVLATNIARCRASRCRANPLQRCPEQRDLEAYTQIVPDILINNNILKSENVIHAEFWEAGAEWNMGFKGEPKSKVEVDTLHIRWKDTDTQYLPIAGPEASRIADDLQKSGVNVYRHLKK
jgi:hypothetical protein